MAGAPWLGAAGCLRRSLCGNQIHSAERYPAEQMLCQIAAEGSAVIQTKAEVLVHVKGVDPGKIQVLPQQAFQHLILRRRSGKNHICSFLPFQNCADGAGGRFCGSVSH